MWLTDMFVYHNGPMCLFLLSYSLFSTGPMCRGLIVQDVRRCVQLSPQQIGWSRVWGPLRFLTQLCWLLSFVHNSYVLTSLLPLAFAEQWKLKATWYLTEVEITMSSADTYFELILCVDG